MCVYSEPPPIKTEFIVFATPSGASPRAASADHWALFQPLWHKKYRARRSAALCDDAIVGVFTIVGRANVERIERQSNAATLAGYISFHFLKIKYKNMTFILIFEYSSVQKRAQY